MIKQVDLDTSNAVELNKINPNVSANKIAYIWTGRDIVIVWNKSGLYKMSIKSWNSLVKKYNIFVLSEEMIAMLRKKFPDNKAIQEIIDNL